MAEKFFAFLGEINKKSVDFYFVIEYNNLCCQLDVAIAGHGSVW